MRHIASEEHPVQAVKLGGQKSGRKQAQRVTMFGAEKPLLTVVGKATGGGSWRCYSQR